MGYIASIYEAIDEVPSGDWMDGGRAGADLPMDGRLLGAFQRTMGHECRCWFLIVRDGRGRAVAWGGVCRFTVDGADTTAPLWQAFTRGLRGLMPGFMRFGVIFCGLPVPGGHSHLRIAEGADKEAVIAAIDAALRKLATQTGAQLVVWREFDATGRDGVGASLRKAGYVCGDVPCAHVLEGTFANLEAYAGALRSGYRRQLKMSRKKFEDAGCTAETLSGEWAAHAFGDDLHGLYRAVRDRAAYRMETLSAEFFRETARRFGVDATLTLALRNGRALGFAFGLTAGKTYHNMYVGLDYAANGEADVYFNLYYHDLDHAFRRGCRRIELGQTSDDFKTRLGSVPRGLYFFARAAGRLMNVGLKASSRWMFPPVRVPAARQVFKEDEERRNPGEDGGNGREQRWAAGHREGLPGDRKTGAEGHGGRPRDAK